MSEKIIGVLGGMGPEATVDFFAKVVALTPAKKDQEHLRIIIDNNPKIPDRTESIIKGNRASLPLLIESAKVLEKAGADFIVIPCNTAHYFYAELVKEVSIPVLNMIEVVVQAAITTLPKCQKVGLLATTGTVNSNLYHKEFKKAGIEVLMPDSETQAKVMKAILQIKGIKEKPQAKAELVEIGNQLLKKGAEAIVLGCTDIPVVVNSGDFPVPVFDSNMVLAQATVKVALNQK